MTRWGWHGNPLFEAMKKENAQGVHLGHGSNGYYVIWNNRSGCAYFAQNELWREYISMKFGKQFFKSRIRDIEAITREVMMS